MLAILSTTTRMTSTSTKPIRVKKILSRKKRRKSRMLREMESLAMGSELLVSRKPTSRSLSAGNLKRMCTPFVEYTLKSLTVNFFAFLDIMELESPLSFRC